MIIDRCINKKVHLLVALATGLGVFFLCVLFRFDSLNPSVWDDVAAAAGLRPAASVLGGFARYLDMWVLRAVSSPDRAFFMLRFLGWLTGGIIAFLAYRVFLGFCGGWPQWMSHKPRGDLVSTLSLVTGAVAFTFYEPVWMSVQTLSATALQLVLALLGLRFLQLFGETAQRRYTFLSMLAWALLSADLPFGLIGVVASGIYIFYHNRRLSVAGDEVKLANPIVRLTMRRFLAIIFAVVFTWMVICECGVFRELRGYEAIAGTGLSASGLFDYLLEWKSCFFSIATFRAFVLAFIVIIFPFVIVRLLRDQSINDEDFIPVRIIAAFIVIALVVGSQLCGVRACWFWNWFEGCEFRHPFVHSALGFSAALTFVWLMLVMGAGFFLKSPRLVARYKYAEAAESAEGREQLAIMNRIRRGSAPAIASLPLVMFLLVVPFRWDRILHGMMDAIQSYLTLTVDDCTGAKRVFTDGYLDAGLELEAYRQGRRLWTINLMAGNGEAEVCLRSRGLDQADDLMCVRGGAFNLLRTWVNDTPERLAETALQLGYELWRGDVTNPVYLATVALPPTFAFKASKEMRDAHTARARALGAEMVALYQKGCPDATGTHKIREALRFAQWRLARIGAMRANELGRDAWNEAAVAEQHLADALFECNASYQRLKQIQGRATEGRSSILTPREGLRLGLERADFKFARTFAESILHTSPDDAEANFAMGMDYFFAENYARAEPYLMRVLSSRPNDPTVLNNLAVVELRLYRYDRAEIYARAALDRMPASGQIRKTLAAIQKAQAAREARLGKTSQNVSKE